MNQLLKIGLVAVLASAATIHAADFLALGRELAAGGEELRSGNDAETGWYVVAVSKLTPRAEGTDPAVFARLECKRRIAGYVTGEKIAVDETLTSSEKAKSGSTGDSIETTETFLQQIKVNIDAFMRGLETVGEIESGGARYLVAAVTSKTIDASKALAEQSAALPPGTVRAVGLVQIVDDDLAAAQKTALATAKSTAVEMVLGTAVTATEAAMNMKTATKLLSNAGGFVRQFRIEEEGKTLDGKSYRVVLLAEVEQKKLMDDYGAFLAQFGDVKFHVEDCGEPVLNAMLEEKLHEWHCPVTTRRGDADYVVYHRWVFRDVDNPIDGRTGTRLSLTLGMFDAATGKQLWVIKNNPRKAVSYVGDQALRKRNAADMAMKEIHEMIHERLDRMIGGMTTSGRDVRMVFDNYSAPYEDALNTMRDSLAKLPGCGEASISVDTAKRTAVLAFRCQTDMETLRTFMEERIKTDIKGAAFRPETISFNANTWYLTW